MFIRTFRLFQINFSSVLAILKVRRSAGPLLAVVLLRVYEPIPRPEVVVTAL